MKNTALGFFRRGITAMGIGPLVLAVLYLILRARDTVSTLDVDQVCIGIFSLSALAFVAGGGIEPVLQRLLSRITPPERRGGVFGFAMTCRMLGTMLGSLTSGIIYYHFGANKVFYGGGILFFLVIPLICAIFPVIKRQFPGSMEIENSSKKSGVSN